MSANTGSGRFWRDGERPAGSRNPTPAEKAGLLVWIGWTLHDLPTQRFLLVINHVELEANFGRAVQAEHLHHRGGTGFVLRMAFQVKQLPHLAVEPAAYCSSPFR